MNANLPISVKYVLKNTQYLGFGTGGFEVADRSAFNAFDGITDAGELLFKSIFTQGVRGIDGANDLVQIVQHSTLPTTGKGSWLGDCVEGLGLARRATKRRD